MLKSGLEELKSEDVVVSSDHILLLADDGSKPIPDAKNTPRSCLSTQRHGQNCDEATKILIEDDDEEADCDVDDPDAHKSQLAS